MYGVAAYGCWGSGDEIKELMRKHYTEHYKSIPIPPASLPSSDGDTSSETDGLNDDTEYKPRTRLPQGRKHSMKMSDRMLNAMDDVLMLSMLVKGRTPEGMARERQRQRKAEENAGAAKAKMWNERQQLESTMYVSLNCSR